MGEPEITTLADGSLRVCLRHHAGVEACCYVSSMHLVTATCCSSYGTPSMGSWNVQRPRRSLPFGQFAVKLGGVVDRPAPTPNHPPYRVMPKAYKPLPPAAELWEMFEYSRSLASFLTDSTITEGW